MENNLKTAEEYLEGIVCDDCTCDICHEFKEAMKAYARQAIEAYRDRCYKESTEMHVENILLIDIDQFIK